MITEADVSSPQLTVGMEIYYYNLWKKYENPALRSMFKGLSNEGFKELKKGDIIFIDQEPYYSHGKVYGYTLYIVTKTETEGDTFKIYYGSKGTYIDNFCSTIAVLEPTVTKEEFLENLKENPWALKLM